MKILNGFVESVGNTPLIRLRQASDETGCEILGKAEFLNPGQSVKDRTALFIIRDAEEKGHLRPGGVIDGTAAMSRPTRTRLLEVCAALAEHFPRQNDRSRDRH